MPSGLSAGGGIEPAWVFKYDALLKKYVDKSGKGVDYSAWHRTPEDMNAMRHVTESISHQSLKGMNRNEKLAFYLNAYNAWNLMRILEAYPVDGPGGGGLIGRNIFFKSKSLIVGGNSMSAADLENDIIRKEFSEPGIHFALNCGSQSCPPLHHSAFAAGSLDSDLDMLARTFINDNQNALQIDHQHRRIYISKIFHWFEHDFGGREGVIDYIRKYSRGNIPANYRVMYLEYSWDLNQSK